MWSKTKATLSIAAIVIFAAFVIYSLTPSQSRRTQIEKSVNGRLRMLAANVDQYYLEHGVDHVTFDQIVGPGKFLNQLSPVDGEDYTKLNLAKGVPWRVVTQSGITVTYER